MAKTTEQTTELLDTEKGTDAAIQIWNNDPEAKAIVDPRTPAFARAMIDKSMKQLQDTPSLIKNMIEQASAGAEGLAIAQFQGIIEVIQNADDVLATEVRLALRNTSKSRQLLIVHNGEPVTCHNVLGMALPYLTTKTDRTDQRGRFGIGMKTLKRIANSVAIHSAPYHFSGNLLQFSHISAETAIPAFYDPAIDTMLVIDLNKEFEEEDLIEWFDAWHHDSLLFLASVSRFRWCTLDGNTRSERTLSFSPWGDVGFALHHPAILSLQSRHVEGPDDSWTVWRATVEVPPNQHPAHKARSEKTDISIALAEGQTRPSLFIGFRTQVPLSLPFSLDAQFDPSTSREEIIENSWNTWLIERSCEVIATIAAGLLASDPKAAWRLIPLPNEYVGKEENTWLRKCFSSSFKNVRNWLSQIAVIALPKAKPALSDIVYEDKTLSGLLKEEDLELIANNKHALHMDVRDNAERWKQVMDALAVSTRLGTNELLKALNNGTFLAKEATWWVEAGSRLVTHHPSSNLLGRPFLLSDQNSTVPCETKDNTARPMVFDVAPSSFAKRWNILVRLHPAYGENDSGKKVLEWLKTNAAFTKNLNAETELEAFAEHFDDKKIEISDEELRELRARFDELPDSRAELLGPKVGAVLLLDGHEYQSDKLTNKKVSISESYLCKTIDGENSTWPDAAGKTPNILWIAAKYVTTLKTDAKRWGKRKRADGSISRGPRLFLTLLGAKTAPRIVRSEGIVRWGNETRVAELNKCNAQQVKYDLYSPDLSRVLKSLQKLNKRDAKIRSSALLKTLSHNWEELYSKRSSIPAERVARIYTYPCGDVAASWLNELRDTPWIAVGRGELEKPNSSVLKTPETQTMYQIFICNVEPRDVKESFATALRLITDVRISDLLKRLETLRDSNATTDSSEILQIYRTIAKRCPETATYNMRIGEITVQDLRRRFLDGDGLIYFADGNWRRPDQVMRGADIFHGRRLFVPDGKIYANLWRALDVAEPNLDDCIQFCRVLVKEPYGINVEATLMDVYRYMERLVGKADRKHREKLRNLPLYCNEIWTSARPLFYVENPELRDQLVTNVPTLKFWKPPCDVRDFPYLAQALDVKTLSPALEVMEENEEAIERGEQIRSRFGHAIDHLSGELARSEPVLREQIKIGWDRLKTMQLYVYEHNIPVKAISPDLPANGILVSLRALVSENQHTFYFREEDIGDRDFGGRALALLFPPEIRRRIDGEWALAWQKSRSIAAEEIRLASDQQRTEAMQETATAINAGPKSKINISSPKSHKSTVKPRTLKSSISTVIGATIQQGTTQDKNETKPGVGKRGLRSSQPEQRKSNESANSLPPTAYTNADLEHRGWEILVQALNTSSDQRLIDFRNCHGVGADGVFDWRCFVEMKATARGPQTQVELSNNEFERAKERGSNFILALVSGLETGHKYEVRLIFDPANSATVRPTNGVKLSGLLNAPAVIVHFEESDEN